MEINVVFGENDTVLIELIEAYQKEKGSSFDEAVRDLCKKGLSLESGIAWKNF